ncbi:MAG TPA: RNA 2',3'-cyclic phosphodiesterase [Roseiflexaceae bacterium]|nr:RNA 2',3'-cyclic phosphodiesterase [Roseiflexaceae bacterium]
MDMETYRLFIGAELPEDVKAELVASQARLRRANLPVAWVAPEAMHLTLRFLGDTSVALIPELCAAIRTAVAPYHAMELRLSGTGAFPNDRRPSVVWIGVGGAVAALGHAQASIETALGELGIAAEPKPFHPHLTLGRVRGEASHQQRQRLGDVIRALPPPAPLAWALERVVLFRSELRREGAVYTEIADCRLQIAD